MVDTKAADPPRVGGSCGIGGLKSKSLKHLKFALPPKRLVLCFWGARGPQKPRQEKNASVWQAKNKSRQSLIKKFRACQVYITMLCKQEASPKKSRPPAFPY